jgi:hypothetical protein
MNLLQPNQALCPLYQIKTEHMHHLFLHCHVSWMFWNHFIAWLGFTWCMLNSVEKGLRQFTILATGKFQQKTLTLLAYGILWTP